MDAHWLHESSMTERKWKRWPVPPSSNQRVAVGWIAGDSVRTTRKFSLWDINVTELSRHRGRENVAGCTRLESRWTRIGGHPRIVPLHESKEIVRLLMNWYESTDRRVASDVEILFFTCFEVCELWLTRTNRQCPKGLMNYICEIIYRKIIKNNK